MVSVIIPVYQAKQTLERCVGCVMTQAYEDIELILVDDGSDDGSEKLCDWLASCFDRIRVIHEENGGAARARNTGIAHASGDWICFIDSDDIFSAAMLDELVGMAVDTGADIAVCAHARCKPSDISNVDSIGDFFSSDDTSAGARQIVYKGHEGVKALLYQRGMLSAPWGMISRKSLWDTVSFPEGTAAEDMGTIYRLFLKADTVTYTDRVLYGYMQSTDNTVFSTSSERNPDYFMHSRDMLEYIRETAPDCTNAASSRHLSACFQILSEIPYDQRKTEFVKEIYDGIRSVRRSVAFDREARRKNRLAALGSYISIGAIHRMLNAEYKRSIPKE